MNKEEDKRGISQVIFTIIMIVFVLVAVGIVWGVIQNIISQEVDDISLAGLTLDAEIKSVEIDGENILVNVIRDIGKGNLIGIKFIFFDGENSENQEREVSLKELEGMTFNFTLVKLNVAEVEMVSIALIYLSGSGEEIISKITNSRNIQSGVGGNGDSGARYITFALSFPMLACDQAVFRQGFQNNVDLIRTNIGTLGDNKNRKLGFALYVPAWNVEKMSGENEDGALCYELLVDTAVDVAIENDVAIHFIIGTHINWDTRPDLWNYFNATAEGYNPDNVNNVEWHDWNGTPNQQNYIGWLPGVRAAPVMCFNCINILNEVERMVNDIFVPTLLSARETFTSAGKPELFAGITIGDEIGIPNWGAYPEDHQIVQLMLADGVEPTRLGYHALINLGFTEADEPLDYVTELGNVNRNFLAFWTQLFNEAGFERDELFTRHPAGQADFNLNHAPLWVAVNDYALPGFSTYPEGPLKEDFNDIYDTLTTYNIINWAGNEGNPVRPSECLSGDLSGRITMQEYLSRHFDNGGVLVNLNANDGREIIRTCLGDAMWDDEAISTYNDFLNEIL